MAEVVFFPKELACQMPSFTALLAGTLFDLLSLISHLFATPEPELPLFLLPVRPSPPLGSLRGRPKSFQRSGIELATGHSDSKLSQVTPNEPDATLPLLGDLVNTYPEGLLFQKLLVLIPFAAHGAGPSILGTLGSLGIGQMQSVYALVDGGGGPLREMVPPGYLVSGKAFAHEPLQ